MQAGDKRMRVGVLRIKGRTEHITPGLRTTDVASLEIKEEDGMYFLFRLDSNGRCVADTCHLSLEEAVAQATWEYEIEEPWESLE